MPPILLVEDNAGDVFLMKEAIEAHAIQCELWVVSDGEKAIRLIDEIEGTELDCPAIVILDLNLPKRTGRDVLRRMRSSLKCGAIPIVIFSSSDAASDKQDAARLGATLYLCKPSDLGQFLQIGTVIRRLLGSRTD